MTAALVLLAVALLWFRGAACLLLVLRLGGHVLALLTLAQLQRSLADVYQAVLVDARPRAALASTASLLLGGVLLRRELLRRLDPSALGPAGVLALDAVLASTRFALGSVLLLTVVHVLLGVELSPPFPLTVLVAALAALTGALPAFLGSRRHLPSPSFTR